MMSRKLSCVMEYWETDVEDRHVLIGVEHEDGVIMGLMVREDDKDGSRNTYSISSPVLYLIMESMVQGHYTVPQLTQPQNPLPR